MMVMLRDDDDDVIGLKVLVPRLGAEYFLGSAQLTVMRPGATIGAHVDSPKCVRGV